MSMIKKLFNINCWKKLILKLRQYLEVCILNNIAGSNICPKKLRKYIYSICGIRTKTQHISANCFVGSGKGLSIGEKTFINYNNFFDLSNSITIGDNVYIGMCSRFITSTHKIGCSERRAGEDTKLPIVIENSCWIGGNVTILPGVTIHQSSVIAAGAVVTKDVEKILYMQEFQQKKLEV